MIEAIIVTLFAAAIVTGYMLTVNWFLRGDEHYHDDAAAKPAGPEPKTAPVPRGLPAGA